MPDNTPETGDVVIRSQGVAATPRYVIRAFPGLDQFGYATREEAVRMARSFAERAGVNLWFSDGPHDFTILVRFRAAARQVTRQPTTTRDAR
jgi:hypothetical protein